jgi:hypothetical protein
MEANSLPLQFTRFICITCVALVSPADSCAVAPEDGPFGMEIIDVGSPGFVPGLVVAFNASGMIYLYPSESA